MRTIPALLVSAAALALAGCGGDIGPRGPSFSNPPWPVYPASGGFDFLYGILSFLP